MNKFDLSDVTFVIPVRIDCIERMENIHMVIDFLSTCFSTHIIILEADKRNSQIVEDIVSKRGMYVFVEDSDPVFYRTKYLNRLSEIVKTPFLAVWDSDVIIHPSQLLSAISGLREEKYDFVFPYDGHFFDTGITHRIKFFECRDIDYLVENQWGMILPYTSTACGGGFLARLADYLECGGENENFYGWGQEDGERVERWKILGRRIRRIKGPMFHLYHPRGKNSKYIDTDHKNLQRAEFGRISSMDRSELIEEIARWRR